jgi:hypothetical protein
MPVPHTRKRIQSSPRPHQQRVPQGRLEHHLILVEPEGSARWDRGSRISREPHVETVEQADPSLLAGFEHAHEGEVRVVDDVAEAEIHLGDGRPDADPPLEGRGPHVRDERELPAISLSLLRGALCRNSTTKH